MAIIGKRGLAKKMEKLRLRFFGVPAEGGETERLARPLTLDIFPSFALKKCQGSRDAEPLSRFPSPALLVVGRYTIISQKGGAVFYEPLGASEREVSSKFE